MTNIAYNPEFTFQAGTVCRTVDNASNGLRFTGYADEINTYIRHRGWFADNFQDGIVRGVVYQLPARNGTEQYIAGYEWPYDETCVILSFDITDDKTTAATWADRMAEIEACKYA